MRALIIGLGIVYVAGSAFAKSVVIGPANCAADADLSAYSAPASVAAADLNPANGAAESLAPIVDLAVGAPGTDEEIFIRLAAEEAAVLSARWEVEPCAAD